MRDTSEHLLRIVIGLISLAMVFTAITLAFIVLRLLLDTFKHIVEDILKEDLATYFAGPLCIGLIDQVPHLTTYKAYLDAATAVLIDIASYFFQKPDVAVSALNSQ